MGRFFDSPILGLAVIFWWLNLAIHLYVSMKLAVSDRDKRKYISEWAYWIFGNHFPDFSVGVSP